MFGLPSYRLFTLFRVDVSISLSYLLMVGLCFYWFGFARGVLAAIAISLSIIIHEFGHALVCKRYDLSPSILLHGLGGLCFHQPASTDGREALITAGGPFLQIFAGGLALVAVFAMATGEALLGSLQPGGAGSGISEILTFSLSFFASFSLFWGIINLVLPVWPLDGGKLFVLLLRRFMPEDRADVWGLRVSLFTLAPLAALALYAKSILLGYIIFSIAMEDYQLLSSGAPLFTHGSGRKIKVKASPFVKEMLEKSRAAYADEDWREAARLCHQLRASNEPLPEKTMDEIWEILGLTAVEMEEWEEAEGWLKRAPQSARVEDARARCADELSRQ